MDSDLDKIVIIGCSAGGKDALDYLIPRIELGNSTVLIVPHINHYKISTSLKKKGVDVIGIKGNTYFGAGKVYEIMTNFERVKLHDGIITIHGDATTGYSILNRLTLFFDELLMQNDIASIDYLMTMAAGIYKERCIGIVLSGIGDDGTSGVKVIKKKGGKVLVQIEDTSVMEQEWYNLRYYVPDMPRNATESTQVDFSGPLPELVRELNQYLQ